MQNAVNHEKFVAANKVKMATFILSTNSLNNLGVRILTSGIDLSLFSKNPVMLFMHERGRIIGHWENIRVEGDQLLADPVFSDIPDAQEKKKLVEEGNLKMASIWIQPLEWSDEPALKLPGQLDPTVTRSLLKEASLVDMGGNYDSLILVDENNVEIKLADIDFTVIKSKPKMKNVIKALSLADNAGEDLVLAAVNGLQSENDTLKASETALKASEVALKAQNADLQKQLNEIKLADFKVLLDNPAKKLTEPQKQLYIKLYDKDAESALEVVKSLPNYSSLTGDSKNTDEKRKDWKFVDWTKNDPKGLSEMKLNDKEAYKALFKAEYGVDANI